MSTEPTFVLVPGNFLPVAYYEKTAELLESHSFSAKLVSIPSTGSSVPLTSNERDISAVRAVLESLVEGGKEIVIVAHSYGISPACEAVKGLSFRERKALGRPGGVIKLVFVAAWLMKEGENPPAILERYKVESPWVRFDESKFYCDDPDVSLFTDTAPEVTAYWKKQVTHSDIAAFATALQYAAWRQIPSTYLICEEDKCLPTFLQEELVNRVDGKVKVERMPSGHTPMLSMPEKFVHFLESEVGETV